MRGREGEAGHDVSPEGKTGEALSSLTVSTKLQWIVEQAETCRAAKSCARVVRTLITEAPDVLIGHIRIRWHIIREDLPLLTEALKKLCRALKAKS